MSRVKVIKSWPKVTNFWQVHFVLKDERGLQNWAYMMYRRENKSQLVVDIFPCWGGGENLVKATGFIGDNVAHKERGELRIWGLAPRKSF